MERGPCVVSLMDLANVDFLQQGQACDFVLNRSN